MEGLEAIVPVAPNTSYYHYYRSNGLVRSPGGYPGEDVDVLFDFVFSGFPDSREYCVAQVREGEMRPKLDRTTGDYNDFWAGRDYLNQIDGVKAATLMAHAFNDWNVMPEHSYRIVQALEARGVPVQVYYHQGGHGGPPPLELVNRWFTRYLLDVDNGRRGRPWRLDRAGGRRPGPAHAVRRLPPPRIRRRAPFTPAATAPGPARWGWRPGPSPRKAPSWTTSPSPGGELAAAEWSSHRLLYATPELREDVHLSGVAKVRIRVAADAPGANLSVWLVSLPWTRSESINDDVITRGWADPSNAGAADVKSPRTGAPLVPGEFVELEFDLQPDDQVVPAGERIGLMIFSSDKDFTLHPDPGTRLQVDLRGTSVVLPVVGGREALAKALTPVS